jgi:uncharacterized membrane protein YoaK (UPF0700 family)
MHAVLRSLWPAPDDRHGPLVPVMIVLGSFLLGASAGGRFRVRHPDHRGHMLRAASIAQAMLLGALVGGLLVLHVTVAAALALAAAIVLAVGVFVHLLSRADAPWVKT